MAPSTRMGSAASLKWAKESFWNSGIFWNFPLLLFPNICVLFFFSNLSSMLLEDCALLEVPGGCPLYDHQNFTTSTFTPTFIHLLVLSSHSIPMVTVNQLTMSAYPHSLQCWRSSLSESPPTIPLLSQLYVRKPSVFADDGNRTRDYCMAAWLSKTLATPHPILISENFFFIKKVWVGYLNMLWKSCHLEIAQTFWTWKFPTVSSRLYLKQRKYRRRKDESFRDR